VANVEDRQRVEHAAARVSESLGALPAGTKPLGQKVRARGGGGFGLGLGMSVDSIDVWVKQWSSVAGCW
jgi:hypothetical protein